MNNNKKLRYLVVAALFSALICISTTTFRIPIGTNGGYIHLGDTFIYIVAALLPKRYSMTSAAIGAALADTLSGAIIWVIPTIIIKAAIAATFSSESKSIICKRNIYATILATMITVVGYYLAEVVMVGNFISPMAWILPNMLQAVGSAVFFVILSPVIEKMNLKEKLVVV